MDKPFALWALLVPTAFFLIMAAGYRMVFSAFENPPFPPFLLSLSTSNLTTLESVSIELKIPQKHGPKGEKYVLSANQSVD